MASRPRRDLGMALTEVVVVVFAVAVPLIALAAVYSYKMGEVYSASAGSLGGGDRSLAARTQETAGAAARKPAGQLDLGAARTGQWGGKGAAGQAAGLPSTRSPGGSGQATTFARESGSAMAGEAPVLIARLDPSAAPAAKCTGARGPCTCPASSGGGLASTFARGLLQVGGAGSSAGGGSDEGGAAVAGAGSGCACGTSAPAWGNDPAYLSLGLGDPIFGSELSLSAFPASGDDEPSRSLPGHLRPPLLLTQPPPGERVVGTGKIEDRAFSIFGSAFSDFATYLDVIAEQRPEAATAYWRGKGYDIEGEEAKLRKRPKGWAPSRSLADTRRGEHVPELVPNFDVATPDYPGGTLLRITDAEGKPVGAGHGNPGGIFRVGDTGERTGAVKGELRFYTDGTGAISDYYEGLRQRGARLRVEVVELSHPQDGGPKAEPPQAQ